MQRVQRLPLNIFEPRYLALVDHALASDRLIGVVQPAPEAGSAESPPGKTFPLRRVGCVGRIHSFNENEDGRVVVTSPIQSLQRSPSNGSTRRLDGDAHGSA